MDIYNELLSIGFNKNYVDAYIMLSNNGCKFTMSSLQAYVNKYMLNISERDAYVLMRIHAIVTGKLFKLDNNVINMLANMKISQNAIMAFRQVYLSGVPFKTTDIQQCFQYSFKETELIMHQYKLAMGKLNTDISSWEDASKHFKKINNTERKINIQDLSVSNITEVPKVAVVKNIINEPYNIWNSNQYSGKAALYEVVKATSSSVTIKTSRKPKLLYTDTKTIKGVLEIMDGTTVDGKAVVKFYSGYYELCNRFVIVASTKRPSNHLGCYSIMCIEGSTLYVFAKNIGTGSGGNLQGNQRVYAYGFLPGEIEGKLKRVTLSLYQQFGVDRDIEQQKMQQKMMMAQQNGQKLNAQDILNELNSIRGLMFTSPTDGYKVIGSNKPVNQDESEGITV